MRRSRILVVDDDPVAARYLRLALAEGPYTLRSAGNGVEALLAVEAEVPDLVFSDLRMPEMNGLELLTRIKQRWPELPFVLITVEDDVSTVVEAIQRGAVNYLVKPVAAPSLLTAAHKALSLPQARAGNDRALPEIVGVTRSLVEVRHLVTVAAASDVNVLISGETGTGKELAARAIHRCSSRGGGPFVAHNCAAIPQDLFESEFFGQRRGAFTGADRDRTGLLERADGGVLLLDELETLSPLHQAKLLRVLDDGEVRPVGSTETRQVSVRFLAATNRDPEAMLAEGSLRADLYYRLRGFQLALPPLREHPRDIPALATHFLDGDDMGFEPEALEALCKHPWPGNVRELRNVVRGARACAVGSRIRLRDLPLDPVGEAGAPEPASDAPAMTLKEIERAAIEEALSRFRGNRSRTARMLGINRSTLRRKMDEYGIH